MPCMLAYLPHTEDHTRGDSAKGAVTAAETRVRWLAKSLGLHALHVRLTATHRGSHTRRVSRGSSDSSGDAGSMGGKVTRRSCPACSRPCHTQRITHASTQQREQRQQRRRGFDGWQSHSASMPCMFACLPHREDHTRGDSAEGAATAAETRVGWLAGSPGFHALHVRVPATHRGSHTRRLSRGSSDSSGDAGLMAGKVTGRSCPACSLACHTQRITHAATQQREQRQQLRRGFDGWQSHMATMPCMFACLPHTEDHTRGDSAEGAATGAETRVGWLAESHGVHLLHVYYVDKSAGVDSIFPKPTLVCLQRCLVVRVFFRLFGRGRVPWRSLLLVPFLPLFARPCQRLHWRHRSVLERLHLRLLLASRCAPHARHPRGLAVGAPQTGSVHRHVDEARATKVGAARIGTSH
eukprot:scaffold15652_cov68-Phaeocystis_antarctica.AAC.3